MSLQNEAKPAPEFSGDGLRNLETFGDGLKVSDNAASPKTQSPSRDHLLISLDFIGEAGDSMTIAGMALCAAAAAENVAAVELALRHARAILRDAIAEFREIAPRYEPLIAAAREYHKSRGARA